jgi:hypothetical protein
VQRQMELGWLSAMDNQWSVAIPGIPGISTLPHTTGGHTYTFHKVVFPPCSHYRFVLRLSTHRLIPILPSRKPQRSACDSLLAVNCRCRAQPAHRSTV